MQLTDPHQAYGRERSIDLLEQLNRIIPLPAQVSLDSRRKIIIPVDIPEVQVVHTAELILQPPTGTVNLKSDNNGTATISTPPTHWPVGAMIPAELHLRHTRRWANPSERQTKPELSFSYEILANSDLWLIGGRRRGNLSVTEEEGRKGCVFRVMLLPQRPGCLLLPGVDVKTFISETKDSAGGSDGEPQRRQISCEVDYRNHGETVVVSPDLSQTTVSLGGSAFTATQGGGGGWLIDSQRRSAVVS